MKGGAGEGEESGGEVGVGAPFWRGRPSLSEQVTSVQRTCIQEGQELRAHLEEEGSRQREQHEQRPRGGVCSLEFFSLFSS